MENQCKICGAAEWKQESLSKQESRACAPTKEGRKGVIMGKMQEKSLLCRGESLDLLEESLTSKGEFWAG
jgi:hypothetical protein